jgi:hypothetical protein
VTGSGPGSTGGILATDRFPLLELFKTATNHVDYNQTACFAIGGSTGNTKASSLDICLSYYTNTGTSTSGNSTSASALVTGLSLVSASSTECYLGINKSVPAVELDVIGSIRATETITTGSDYRIKNEIKPLLLEDYSVNNLKPVTFKFKKDNKESIGLIAHELQEYYPFLVEGEKDGEQTQTVNYNGLIGVLIKEIQVLKGETKELKREMEELKQNIL